MCVIMRIEVGIKIKYSGISTQCIFSLKIAKQMAAQLTQKTGLIMALVVTRVDWYIAKNAIPTKTNSKPDHQNGI